LPDVASFGLHERIRMANIGFLELLSGRSVLSPDEPVPLNLYESIRDHLVILLNTRRGAIPHLPEYGLPDLSDIYKGYPDSLHDLGAEIKRTVTQFEPRLLQVKIELESNSLSYFEANYAIIGYLQDEDGGRQGVAFRTMISQGGKATVGI